MHEATTPTPWMRRMCVRRGLKTEAVRNRSERFVFAGLEKALFRFPFSIQGIDSDNDSAFINNHLVRYCTERKITFTRSRPYRKNDNCFVEQKNYSVVR